MISIQIDLHKILHTKIITVCVQLLKGRIMQCPILLPRHSSNGARVIVSKILSLQLGCCTSGSMFKAWLLSLY